MLWRYTVVMIACRLVSPSRIQWVTSTPAAWTVRAQVSSPMASMPLELHCTLTMKPVESFRRGSWVRCTTATKQRLASPISVVVQKRALAVWPHGH